jgi:HAD superfamily hydrolase (TIGR01509 family)
MKHNIEAIIFDLGGVLLNIDFCLSQKAFIELGLAEAEQFYNKHSRIELFDDLERGIIQAEQFYDEIRKLSGKQLSNDIIQKAWNAMLLDFPNHRIALLKELKKHYRIFLLSNTNIIHYEYYTNQLKQQGVEDFDNLFHKAYYSFRSGKCKPSSDFFNEPMIEYNLLAESTLFIDDTMQHIQQAKSIGIVTYHIDNDEEVCSLFENGKLKL